MLAFARSLGVEGVVKWPLTFRSKGTLRRQAGCAPLTSNVGRHEPSRIITYSHHSTTVEALAFLLPARGMRHWLIRPKPRCICGWLKPCCGCFKFCCTRLNCSCQRLMVSSVPCLWAQPHLVCLVQAGASFMAFVATRYHGMSTVRLFPLV